jgi:hypothetical protein
MRVDPGQDKNFNCEKFGILDGLNPEADDAVVYRLSESRKTLAIISKTFIML